MSEDDKALGFSGRFAGTFVHSKLTPLIILVSLALGAFATLTTAREEDPSVTVTVADVLIAFPGHEPAEVDERIARPVSAWILEIPTVEHVNSSATNDGALFIVQFRDGVEREVALTQLYERMMANQGLLPPGALTPMITPRGIEDVAEMSVSLWHEGDDPALLRRVGAELAAELEALPQVSHVDLIGGMRREISVELDARRLAERGLAANNIVDAIRAANVRLPAGDLAGPGGRLRIDAGTFLSSAHDVESLIVGVGPSGPTYLRDIADVRDLSASAAHYVSHADAAHDWASHSAITIAVRKVRGSDGAVVTARVREAIERSAPELFPEGMHWSATHDAGVTATHRVVSLIEHMALATLIVVVLIAIALGRKEALIVAVVIPVTLAIVPFVYKVTGFTLNRITLSAMIFAIGILVDDAIVIIENVHRHYHERDASVPTTQVILEAVAEVGNPTILATFAVIAALGPTAFVSGMIGQFLRALPIGASVAMFYSLVIALAVTPYLCIRLLRRPTHPSPQEASAEDETASKEGGYHRALSWVMERPARMFGAEALTVLMLLGSLGLVVGRVATVKVLPLGDVDEVAVVIDVATDSTLETTQARMGPLTRALGAIPEVAAVQAYVGTPGPLSFQGVARHYMMREEPYQAELQVQLVPGGERERSSHEVALQIRSVLADALSTEDVWFTVVEVPPGPPVQAALVAEVYGPDEERRLAAASELVDRFEANTDVVDVGWTARRGPPTLRFEVDPERASAHGVAPAQVAMTLRTLFSGDDSVQINLPREREPVAINLRLNAAQRVSASDIESLYFTSLTGEPVAAADIGELRRVEGVYPLLRKDLQAYVAVTAEVEGEGPLYAALDITDELEETVVWTSDSIDTTAMTVRWGGEWTVTYELFRDLGLAFIVVLFLIYVMLVAWYRSFLIPLVVMLPIPTVFVGVVPGHLLLGLPISGMAVIGVIALAGLMVRNSILLIDFANELLADGKSPREAALIAGQTRLRPIVLTALTVVLGDGVLFFDPLLQGLGLTMASGALFSTMLTVGIVPIAYYQLSTWSARWSQSPVAEQAE